MGRTSELMIEQELSNCGISSWSEKVMCPHCRQIYIQDTETQMPGFRDKDYLIEQGAETIIDKPDELFEHL